MFAMSAQIAAGLVREHDDLDTVVRHTLGHPFVSSHHATAEIFVLAFDGKRAAAIPDPVGELGGGFLRSQAMKNSRISSYLTASP